MDGLLTSLVTILNQFLVNDRKFTCFDIYNIITHRGYELTDIYYLCNVRNSWFIIYETSHFTDFGTILIEAEDIFNSERFELSHWIGPKDVSGKSYLLPINVPVNTLSRMGMKYIDKETNLTYVVISLNFFGTNLPRYEPEPQG